MRTVAGVALRSRLSASASSSLLCDPVPSHFSVAHCRTFHPSPSPRPRFSRSRKWSKSSIASWYPVALAWACSHTAFLYRFVTDRAAALNCWRSCSGGCGRGVELGREVLSDLMESMAGKNVKALLGGGFEDESVCIDKFLCRASFLSGQMAIAKSLEVVKEISENERDCEWIEGKSQYSYNQIYQGSCSPNCATISGSQMCQRRNFRFSRLLQMTLAR